MLSPSPRLQRYPGARGATSPPPIEKPKLPPGHPGIASKHVTHGTRTPAHPNRPHKTDTTSKHVTTMLKEPHPNDRAQTRHPTQPNQRPNMLSIRTGPVPDPAA